MERSMRNPSLDLTACLIQEKALSNARRSWKIIALLSVLIGLCCTGFLCQAPCVGRGGQHLVVLVSSINIAWQYCQHTVQLAGAWQPMRLTRAWQLIKPTKTRQHMQSMRASIQNFSMPMYETMIADTVRTEAYAQALQDTVNDGDKVVDIGTGPFAILASQAVQAGAGRVFALEANRKTAEATRRFLNMSSDPWISKIELIEGTSENTTLPVAADVVVHELLGDIASREGAAAIIRDAFARHVARSPRVDEGTWTVPARARSWLVPVEMPTDMQLQAMGSAAFEQRARLKRMLMTDFENFPFAQRSLASPQCFEVLDFSRVALDPTALTGTRTSRLKFLCTRPGVLAGFAIFITGEMTPQAVASADAAETEDSPSECYFTPDATPTGISFCSAWPRSSWPNPFVRLNRGKVNVERGDVVEVEATVDLTPFNPKYAFRATLQRRASALPWPFEDKNEVLVLDGVFQ